jgi:ferredoxin/flavodoxin---NADP+ reductase
MYEIVAKEALADVVTKMTIKAPPIAQKIKPGQFVILRVCEEGERIPLTVFSADPAAGTLTVIFQKVGKTTLHMDTLKVGESLASVTGPLGKATHIEKYGTVVSVSGGVGTAIGYPVTKALKGAGNHIITILGARTESLLLLENDLKGISDEFYVCTDDGSKGLKGLVSDQLKTIIDGGTKVDLVIAIGPLPMMRALAELTRPYGIKTIVSLDSLMIDGTGMCGGCRVKIGNDTKFTCMDGPEFDAHQVDWEIMRDRKRIYLDEEKVSKERFLEKHECKLA